MQKLWTLANVCQYCSQIYIAAFYELRTAKDYIAVYFIM